MEPIHILIGGEAGQGLQTVGPIFARSLVRSGYSVHVTQTYESRVRGGHNTFSIRTGTERVLAGEELIDLLIALDKETVEIQRKKLKPKKSRIIGNAEWGAKGKGRIGVPLKELGEEIYWNMASVGVAASLLGLDQEVVSKAVEDGLGKERFDENRKVLESSYRWVEEQGLEWEKLPPVSKPPKRWVLHGHEAVALGAISAGMKLRMVREKK